MKVAIIGAGAISPAHVKGYLEFQDTCQIVALCDIYPDKAQALAKDFALDVEIYDDHKKMLERTDIDLVSVCTPPYTHADISIDFLNADTHVLVEKPMASSLAERSEEHTSELQSRGHLVCRLLLEKKNDQ